MSLGETTSDVAVNLTKAFDTVIKKYYGHLVVPEPLIMPTRIKHLDALLGGGFISSGPVIFHSTPETGKSTFAYQLASLFLQLYQNGVVFYIDVEGSGSQETTQYKVSRVQTFGLDKSHRFMHKSVSANVEEVYELINKCIEVKKKFEEKTNEQFYTMFIWDSVAATRCTKTDTVTDHNKIIGLKAREISFYLEKLLPFLKFNRSFFFCIDQVRAKMQIDGPFAQKEKSVGEFKNTQAATAIYSLLHNTQQWIFLSKGKRISINDGMGIEGWILNINTEKNKLAPSQHAISCVFDMNYGISKFWSEFVFLSEATPSEAKIYRNKKMPFPLMIVKASAQKYQLHVQNPSDKSINYKSDTFFKKEAKKKYETDEEFGQWFDYAVELSAYHRITHGMFREDMTEIPGIDFDEETGEYFVDEEQVVPEQVEEEPEPEEQVEESEQESGERYSSIF